MVGCGIAGSTVAWQLAEQGHRVTVFEQAVKCGPVGAGILLQPSGQAVLERLGLLEAIVGRAAKIDALQARHRSGRVLVHLDYRKISSDMQGYGVLRSHLFELLFERCQLAGVDIREGQQVESYQDSADNISIRNRSGQDLGQFDILIAADGSRSVLRKQSGLIRKIHEYDDAALWATGPLSDPSSQLLQVVDPSGRLAGVLPVGSGRCSFFWGIRKSEQGEIRADGIDAWKRQVVRFLPAAEAIVAEFDSLDELTYASYRSVRMHASWLGRVIFIGDAAHASSPHLGQGLNLALVDAVCLADQIGQLKEEENFELAFSRYDQIRRPTHCFYSRLTGFLTPFFQTRNRILQIGRNLVLPLLPQLPYVGKQMALTMAGMKSGWVGGTSDLNHRVPPFDAAPFDAEKTD